jgi:hypothetical protein
MSIDKSRKLSKKILTNDETTFTNLKAVTNYAPANKNFEVAKGTPLQNEMRAKQDALALAKSAYKAAIDNAKDSEWSFHDFILGAKSQVGAQFGVDSNELQSLGIKKKSERKRPTRKGGKGGKNNTGTSNS